MHKVTHAIGHRIPPILCVGYASVR